VTGLAVTGHRRTESHRALKPVRLPVAVPASGRRQTAVANLGYAVTRVHERPSAPRRPEAAALDIAALVKRAAAGDHRAWERLVEQFARLIWALTRDFRLSESDASDVAQATWLRLLEHIDRLQRPDRVGSWLAATARHECLRAMAARKKTVLVDDDLALHDASAHQPQVDERLLAEERAQAVRAAIARLPEQWQQLMELLMADPPATYAEISDKLGLPIGSIGPTRGRCLARLRVLLATV
jgi:RNA polymerase sigma factor (sigma-70 family)